MPSPAPTPSGPHLVAWNLTARCNLACPHCYLDAVKDPTHEDMLDTAACHRIVDEVLAAGTAPMFVLTGGEPLLRHDLEEIAAYATEKGATVVVGTNGTALTATRLASLQAAGVQGFALSVDSLDPAIHDAFRGLPGALMRTFDAVENLRAAEAHFVVQTTLSEDNQGELEALADWAAAVGAVAFNVYTQVETGRASGASPLAPEAVEAMSRRLVDLERRHRGTLMVRSKCQPHFVRLVVDEEPDSPLLSRGAGCPAGLWYCRIDQRGQVTPCPYLPVVAGDLSTRSFVDIWRDAPVLQTLREQVLGGKCGACELRQVCRGCRARAFAQTGDVMAADDSCTHLPDPSAPVRPPRPRSLGQAAAPELVWTAEAEDLVKRIPSFVRGMVVGRVEDWARRNDREVIDAELLVALRTKMPGHPGGKGGMLGRFAARFRKGAGE